MDDEGEAIEGASYPEAQAQALWNYIFITEDRSMGVHNASYTEALLEWSLAQFP